MKTFTSLDLQRPRMVMTSVDEFARLKEASGEQVSREIVGERRAVVRRGLPDDPLGYDTSHISACALAMAEAALSGRNHEFVASEIAAVEKKAFEQPMTDIFEPIPAMA